MNQNQKKTKNTTEAHSIQEQLENDAKETSDLRYALDQTSIVAYTDARGTITFVNDKFCEISKYSRHELMGQNHRIINSGYHSKEFFIHLWKTISSGKIWRDEIRNRAKDDTYYWVYTTIIPFMSPEGRPLKYIAIRTDITKQKLAQEQIQQQRMALMHAEKMASIGELAAGIAHELGNPLATIRGRMEFLQMRIQAGDVEKKQILETLKMVEQLCDRMTAIIRGMRSLSRDGTNDPFEKACIETMIKDVLEFSRDSFQKHGIRIITPELNHCTEILCQPTQIGQVLVNLLSNAKDAIVALKDRWIKIEVINGETSVDIAITDSGTGIPKEIQEKMMLPFFTTKAMGKGSGLGLSIAKVIIDAHHGTICIDNESPNTKFIITLPKGIY